MARALRTTAVKRKQAEASMNVVTKKEESRVAASDARAMGICSTCNQVDTCTGRETWVGPVYHCEEFDDHVETAHQSQLRAVASESVDAASTAPGASSRQGLCINCDQRDECSFPIPEGGVWHCEEYE
jgi:hypothetical protein